MQILNDPKCEALFSRANETIDYVTDTDELIVVQMNVTMSNSSSTTRDM
jgi:hypothetical protein